MTAKPPSEPPITVEVLSDQAYLERLEQQRRWAEQDRQARDRARRLLEQCQQGFTPNLIQGMGLSAFDTLVASRGILQLLSLSLGVDHSYQPGQPDLTYLQASHRSIAHRCGQQLYQLGGVQLLRTVLEQWIPAFDQDNLREVWQDFGI
ncbi:MAG: hypothetical protein HC934_04290 [Acaryochloridaceae cyanobacterium SU_2_1]|nr:hypothetical protein [Acaryochloridaceae cyanobacterium SU_2_1]